MDFDLVSLARRASNSRRNQIIFRPIFTTKAQADSLALIYLKAVDVINQRIPRIVSTYERTLEQTLRTDTVDELGGEMAGLEAELRRVVLELTPDLRRWALSTETWHRGKWTRNVLDAVNVNLETMIGPADVRETLDAFLQRNASLVANVTDEARGRIADAVFRGFQRRAPATEVAREIREAASMARKRSIRIAGDQTVKLASALTAERRRQAGLEKWKWKHSGKLHYRPEHLARNGKIYTDATAPQDLPGVLPYCGCVEQAVLEFEPEPIEQSAVGEIIPLKTPETRKVLIAPNKGKTLAKLTEEARINQDALRRIGHEVDRSVDGAEFVEPPAGFEIKSVDSILRKVRDEGYSGPHELTDISRASFIVENPEAADEVVRLLAARGRIYDKGWQTLPTGYRDRKVYLSHPNGGVSEIQFVPKPIAEIKFGEGHRLYEIARLTSNPMSEREAAMQKSRELYEGALAETDFSGL